MSPESKNRAIRIALLVSIGSILLAALWYWRDFGYDFSGLGKIYSSRRSSWESVRGRKIRIEKGLPGPETRHLPDATISIATTLADQTYLGMDILVKTGTAEEARKVERRADRIQLAFHLSTTGYDASQLGGNNRNRALQMIEEILNEQIRIPVEKVYIIRFDIKSPDTPGG